MVPLANPTDEEGLVVACRGLVDMMDMFLLSLQSAHRVQIEETSGKLASGKLFHMDNPTCCCCISLFLNTGGIITLCHHRRHPACTEISLLMR